MVTDGCATGISGVVSQGSDWKTAKIAAFYSAKLNPAQQNYPVHEIEMLAGVETMLRRADILQGTQFKWLTDHKGLTYLLNQKNLSGRQARWLEKISSFTFEVVYIAGCENILADALSRMYSNDSVGTERARSEFTFHDVVDEDVLFLGLLAEELPVLAGMEARMVTRRSSRARTPSRKAVLAEEAAASRMKDRFVLGRPRRPAERKEGGSTAGSSELTTDDSAQAAGTVAEAAADSGIEDMAEMPRHDGNNSLLNIVSQSLDGVDLVSELRGKYSRDPAFQPILDRPVDFRNFEVKEQLVYLIKGPGERVLCIPKILVQGRSARELVISEAHLMLAHLSAAKTLDYLRDHVWWKDMVSDVSAFCETCSTCKTSKPSNQKPYGFLNPLSIPSYPWESIGMDFVGPLPESGNRDGLFDSITVVICLLTSMVHLIPSRTNYNAPQLAELMFEHVYKLHGLPKNIISDRDVLFTSAFWGQLHRLIGTKLRLSSAYHPQSDGSTERANRTITQMLRQCVHPDQKDWVSKLPVIEFAINSARSESTGFAPFFLNSGRMPRSMIWTSPSSSEYPSVRTFALQKKLAIMAAHDSILSARVKQTRDANRKRRVSPFQKGDLVYLSTKNISFAKGLARKLLPKFIGPYKILQDFDNSSFRLDLPSHLKQRGVHDVFHSSLLREHVPNDDRLFPGRMDTQLGFASNTEGEWAVEKILSHVGAKTDATFEIKWKSGDITWLPHYQITHLQALTDYLDLLGCQQINTLPSGAGRAPQEDPQIHLGTISLSTTITTSAQLHTFKELPFHSFFDSLPSFCPAPSVPYLPFTGIDRLAPIMPANRRPADGLRGINHSCFTRTSPTTYIMDDPEYPSHVVLHTGQIAEYLRFNDQLKVQPRVTTTSIIPSGFLHFSAVWNERASIKDSRRVCSLFYDEGTQTYETIPTKSTLRLSDFFITPIQAGFLPDSHRNHPPTAYHEDLQREFTALMLEKQKKARLYHEQREARRLGRFNPDPEPPYHEESAFRPRQGPPGNRRNGSTARSKPFRRPKMTFKQRLQQRRQQQNDHRSPTPSRFVQPPSPSAALEQELPADPEDEDVADDEDQTYEEEYEQPEDLIQLDDPESTVPPGTTETIVPATGPMDTLN